MKINEITVGQKIKYGTPYGDTTGFVHAVNEDSFHVSCECLLGGIVQIKKDAVLATVENVVTEKLIPVTHPSKMEFVFQPQSYESSFGRNGFYSQPTAQMKGVAFLKERVELDVNLPAFVGQAQFNGKGFKVTVEEIL